MPQYVDTPEGTIPTFTEEEIMSRQSDIIPSQEDIDIVEAYRLMEKKINEIPDPKEKEAFILRNADVIQQVNQSSKMLGPAFQKISGTGALGEFAADETHPEFSYKDRLQVKLSNPRPQDIVNTLEKKYPDFAFVHDNDQVYMKKLGEQKWYPLDPQTGAFSKDTLQDIGEVVPEVAVGAPLQALGMTGGFLAGGPIGAMGGSALAGSATEAILQAMSGTPMDPEKIATTGLVSGALSVPGIGASQISRPVVSQLARMSPAIKQMVAKMGTKEAIKKGIPTTIAKDLPQGSLERILTESTTGWLDNPLATAGSATKSIVSMLGKGEKLVDKGAAALGSKLAKTVDNPVEQLPIYAKDFGKKVNTLIQKKRKELSAAYNEVEKGVANQQFTGSSDVLKQLNTARNNMLKKARTSPAQYQDDLGKIDAAIRYFSEPKTFSNVRDMLSSSEKSNLEKALSGEDAVKRSVREGLDIASPNLYKTAKSKLNEMAPGRSEIDKQWEEFIDNKSLDLRVAGRPKDIDTSKSIQILSSRGPGDIEARDRLRNLVDSLGIPDTKKRAISKDLGQYKNMAEYAKALGAATESEAVSATQTGIRQKLVQGTLPFLAEKSAWYKASPKVRSAVQPITQGVLGSPTLKPFTSNFAAEQYIGDAVSRDPEWIQGMNEAQQQILKQYINGGQ